MSPSAIALLVGTGASLPFMLVAFLSGRRRRLMASHPTCKTTGIFMGQVEVVGRAQTERPMISPFAEVPCVYRSSAIYEHWSRWETETYTDDKGRMRTRRVRKSGRTVVWSEAAHLPFDLVDDYGAVRVESFGAEVHPVRVFDVTCRPHDALYYGKGPAGAVSDSDHVRDFEESAIPIGTQLYVLGFASERGDVVAPKIAKHPDQDAFVVSVKREESLRTSRAWLEGVFAVLSAIVVVVAGVIALSMGRASTFDQVAGGALGFLIWLGVYGGVWLVLTYNMLVSVRSRVKKAFANIDVQLIRRRDLIENLVTIAKRYAEHEREISALVAELRSRGGEAVVAFERYPRITADEQFAALHRSLSDTENRLALARGYFNEMASYYNTLIGTFPHSLLAAMARMGRFELNARRVPV